MIEKQIKYMVDRFLGWKLPESFNPDGGVSFKKTFNDHMPQPGKHEPSGTNLLDANQADAMVRYMVEGMGQAGDFRWLVEAPGPKYLAVQRLSMSDNFEWTGDHNKALAFRSKEQADGLMMAVRQMDKGLFAFEATLGNARPVEHGWM